MEKENSFSYYLKIIKEILIIFLIGMAVCFFYTHWNQIAAVQAAGVLLQIQNTKNDVDEKATIVRQLEARTQKNNKDTEIVNVKMQLINHIQGEYFKTFEGMAKSPAAVNLVFNYHPHQTGEILKRKLSKDKIAITTEIAKDIDLLEKLMNE